MAKILIVDDDVAVHFGLGSLLINRGHEVASAATAGEAIALVTGSPYDTIVLDNRLEAAGGDAGLRVLRALRDAATRPWVIFVTGTGSAALKRAALELGADRYFEKPVSALELAGIIEEFGGPVKVA